MPPLKSGTISPTDEEDAVINASIAADPDTYELQEADIARLRPVRRGRPVQEQTKVATTIRLDPYVIEHFQCDRAFPEGRQWLAVTDQCSIAQSRRTLKIPIAGF